MTKTKLNFTIATDVAEKLRERVGARRRSAFVTAAIRERLEQLEEEQLRKTLTEGYAERRSEDADLSGEWGGPTLEGWR